MITLANVVDPGEITSDEPIASAFSAENAARYLDIAALHWQKSRNCVSCHTSLGYLFARPALDAELRDSGEVRKFFEEYVTDRWPKKAPRNVQETVVVAAGLAFNDVQTSGRLQPVTRQAFQVMWSFQREDGGWTWRNDGFPPTEYDEHYGVTLAALATGVAPDGYADAVEAECGLAKIRLFLKNQRVSGKWFARSPAKDSRQYFSNFGSAFAILALQSCGQLPGWPLSRGSVADDTVAFVNPPARLPGEVAPSPGAPAISGVAPSAQQVPQYGRLELAVDLRATYDNPYDPDDVRLDALFTAPSGKQLVVPGFLLVKHRREVREGSEFMIPEDGGTWQVRFTPREAGRYSWKLKLRDRTGEVAGGEGTFQAVKSENPGFIGKSAADPHYLAFDNGQGYFAIGHNLPIYHTTGQLGVEAMRKFAAAGENFNRWWMSSQGFGIEWMDKLGWYRQDVAARIDIVLDLAEELGLYYMMCMDTHQDFREGGWKRNPFNAANGGPCAAPADWFTNARARELYRKRLRYTVARWGYSPHVLCWEFGNEFEGWADSPDEIKLPWHKEMADYLRSIDPFGHLITTSFWGHTGPEEFWNLENIDIVQTHCYTNNDANVAEQVRQYCLHQWERFQKPHIFGEFGIRSHSTTADKDPQGWAIHNSLWAGLFSFSAGGPMPWWHEQYIDKLDLYFHFTALANFARDLPLGTVRWAPLAVEGLEFVDKNRIPEMRDAVIVPVSQWGKPEHNEFTILSDGSIEDGRSPQVLLHGAGHAELKNPPTFLVQYPRQGQFVVHVDKVSHSGLLRVWIDEDLTLERELPCGEGLGKGSVWREQWKLWETTYDEDIAVDVPAGKHRIRIENFGRDWVAATKYVFTGCQVLEKPDVLVCGMKTEDLAIVWLQNKMSTWYNHAGGGQVGRVDPFELTLTGLRDGKCRLEWWETWKGGLQRAEEIEVRQGQFKLAVPSLTTDVALKFKPI